MSTAHASLFLFTIKSIMYFSIEHYFTIVNIPSNRIVVEDPDFKTSRFKPGSYTFFTSKGESNSDTFTYENNDGEPLLICNLKTGYCKWHSAAFRITDKFIVLRQKKGKELPMSQCALAYRLTHDLKDLIAMNQYDCLMENDVMYRILKC